MMRIAFLGTPDFAVPSLRALYEAGHTIACVYTQPDRPKGRGGKVEMSPVKVWALEHGLPVAQPERIRRKEWVAHLQEVAPNAMVTAAFGQILSQANLDVPRYGCINVHASLLPKYRGPAPIAWAIMNGETRTGITTMFTDRGVDTGDMIERAVVDILPEDTAETLSTRLADVGADLLVHTLSLIEAGDAPRERQDEAQMTYFPMLTKELGRVDWNQPARKIVYQVRGLNPWPVAWMDHARGAIKIWEAEAAQAGDEGVQARAPGTIRSADPRAGLVIAAGEDTALRIRAMQAPGGKRMPAADFLRGKADWFRVGDRLV